MSPTWHIWANFVARMPLEFFTNHFDDGRAIVLPGFCALQLPESQIPCLHSFDLTSCLVSFEQLLETDQKLTPMNCPTNGRTSETATALAEPDI
ncbi:MAG TPA: hypothetical protein DEP84_09890 [Chloroflexi bacterium]|nr:hypothetical protein [Chloroflexota bacterium]